MNDKRDPNHRNAQRQVNDVITTLMVYLISGAMIVYGGVNVSFNTLQWYQGLYTGQWFAALPFVLIFGLLPISAGILLLMLHPATRTKKPNSR